MISVCVYKPGDIEALLDVRKFFSGDKTLKGRVDAISEKEGVTVRTLVTDEGIIAVVGGTLLWPGVMELWSVTSNKISRHPISYTRTVRTLIQSFQKSLSIRRFQSVIRFGHPELIRWIEALGFEREALMKRYGPEGADYYMYARTF